MPLSEIDTERLLLRPVGPGDAPDLQALAAAEAGEPPDPAGAPFPTADVERWIAEQQAGWQAGTHCTFAARTRAGAFVGVVQLRRSPSAPRAELGFATAPGARRQGYATEACRAVLRFAFEHLRLARVSALCLETNRASVRVLEKLGFRLAARLEPEGAQGGGAAPLLFYVRTCDP